MDDDLISASKLATILERESPQQVVDSMVAELGQTKAEAQTLFSELADKEEVFHLVFHLVRLHQAPVSWCAPPHPP